MARCPQCNTSYDADVRRCPTDGTALAVSLSAKGSPAKGTAHTELARSSDSGTAPDATFAGKVSAQSAPRRARGDFDTDTTEVDDAQQGGLEPGTLVGEYEVTGVLGAGGLGTVYSGVHPLIAKKVAIKVLNPGLSQDATIVQRFIQEARAVNQIGHRNIVDIFSFGQLPSGLHYFVMEHLLGKSLRARLDEGPLSYQETFTMLSEVCDALVAAHAEGIVHRDLKPDNIHLVASKSGERSVKLLDFGIAKLLRADEKKPQQQTRTGSPIGTPLYMSPEQCVGRNVDARTDVYSLGVIMFEVYTGQLPFRRDSYIETVTAHIHMPPPRPSELVELPAELEALILRCLEKDPADRPQSIADLQAELTRISRQMLGDVMLRTTGNGHPSAGLLTPVRRTPVPPSAPRSRRPLLFGALALAALATTAGIALATRDRHGAAALPAPQLELQVISDPSGALVLFDGVQQSLRTPNIFHLTWRKSLRVRVEREGFAPFEQSVALADGELQRSVVANLTALQQPGGRLQVTTTAQQPLFSLDGKRVAEGTEKLDLASVAPGNHRLRIEAVGFEPREGTINIQPRQLSQLEWPLTPVVPSHRRHATRSSASPPQNPPVDENAISGWHR